MQDMTTTHDDEPKVDVDLVKEWARRAGQIALGYFNRVEGTRKVDRTLVSDADLEMEDLLTGFIREAYPDHGIIGEEGTRDLRGQCTWVIDPLDGTRSFLSGLPIWGVSIGLLWRGQPWLGVFHLPLLDDWYYSASPAAGAFWNGLPIHCPPPDGFDDNSLLCVPADVHLKYHVSFPGTMRALGSAAAHLCYVARGNAAAALLYDLSLWDVAAGAAILRAAGGTLGYLEGGGVPTENLLGKGTRLQPMVAAHASAVDLLRGYIQPMNCNQPQR
jgi:fructose-1,6-bisphosphatase/inositol monophosphatase family enzyme